MAHIPIRCRLTSSRLDVLPRVRCNDFEEATMCTWTSLDKGLSGPFVCSSSARQSDPKSKASCPHIDTRVVFQVMGMFVSKALDTVGLPGPYSLIVKLPFAGIKPRLQ